ncbi:MAG: type IV pilin-like G/H family protein [Nostoc sp.]|uniref:type IV pilin-like G/H family protein n=1 Tax=Nostoc sp. TaxID=1180 RepID=UPI002FF6D34E
MPDVTKQSDRTKINFKRIFLPVGVGALILGFIAVFIQVPPSCGCGDSSQTTIGSFIRAQQAYFSEKSAFAESYRLLELGDGDAPAVTARYRYSVEMSKDESFIYATPIKEFPTDLFKLGLTKKGFNSLVGAITYDKKNKSTVLIICRSEKTTLHQPPKPIFRSDKFICPIGFDAIRLG